ncbi:DoxX family protein [Oceanobacillus sp. CAU 1775]
MEIAAVGKVTGSKMHIENFIRWKLSQGFRVVTGILEIVGAILLIIGYWAPYMAMIGALLLVFIGIGGVLTHLRIGDSFKDTAMILFLAILSLVVFILYVV